MSEPRPASDLPITYAGPTGRERPGEHWNARIIREVAEAKRADATLQEAMRDRDAARAEVERLTGFLAQTERLAAALALALYEAHPTYGSTAGHRGGAGGQTVTQGCSFIDPPPGMEFVQYDLLSKPLREFLDACPFDLNKAKADLLTELRQEVSRG